MQKIKKIPKKYLYILGVVIIIAIYFIFFRTSTTETTYVYGKVKTGEISIEVTGTGQISAANEVAFTAKAAGKITALPAIVGQELKAGELIAQVDARDAYISLQTAQIALQKLTQPADAVTAVQTQNSYDDAVANQNKAYDTAVAAMASSFVDFPEIMNGLNDLYFTPNGYLSDQRTTSLSPTAATYRDDAVRAYAKAKNRYDIINVAYKNITRSSGTSTVEASLREMYDATSYMTQAIKDAKSAIDYINRNQTEYYASGASVASANIDSWSTKINSHLSELSSAKNTMESSSRSVVEKKESLAKLYTGADPLDIQSQQLSLQQKVNAYNDAFTRAPFDGVLAKLNVKLGDEVSNGTSIGTFITKQKIATISLNEIDAAKIKVGQKVSLSLDAIDGLKIDGTVSEVDLVGTVSQGVVTYSVKIALETQDERIRSGMSISATIVTESKKDILIIPNGSIKNNMVQTKTGFIKIKTGITNDSMTEVLEGLKEGDEIVTKTVAGTKTTSTTAPSILGNVRAAGANRAR